MSDKVINLDNLTRYDTKIKDHIDTKTGGTEEIAKAYTDEQIVQEVSDRNTAISTAKAEAISTAAEDATAKAEAAKTYTDTKIAALDFSKLEVGPNETIAEISETDGKISVTTQSIEIEEAQVVDLVNDLSNKLDKKPDGTNVLIDESNKINTKYIPDAILGQMLFGGTINYTEGSTTTTGIIATPSNNLRSKLSLKDSDNYIKLINSAVDDTTTIYKQYGYKTLEGVYFLAQNAFDITVGIEIYHFQKGDWLISIGTNWEKIDNTDAVTGVKGNAESDYRIGNVNITSDNIGLGSVVNATMDDAPIENSTNYAKSGGIYSAIEAAKTAAAEDATTKANTAEANAKTYTDSEIKKEAAARDTAISNAIKALDYAEITPAASETIKSISETDGIIAVEKQAIQIAESQVTNLETDLANKQTTLVAGDNITIATDGKTISATDTTYSVATTTTSGLMSAADKTKLNGISANATATSVASTGTATDEVQYITINETEYKLASGKEFIFTATEDPESPEEETRLIVSEEDTQKVLELIKSGEANIIMHINFYGYVVFNLPYIHSYINDDGSVDSATFQSWLGDQLIVTQYTGESNTWAIVDAGHFQYKLEADTGIKISGKSNNKVGIDTTVVATKTDLASYYTSSQTDTAIAAYHDSTKQNISDKVTTWSTTVDDTHYPSEKLVKDSLDAKSVVSVSDAGSATEEVNYITVNGIEKKLAGSSLPTAEEANLVLTSADTSGAVAWTKAIKVAAQEDGDYVKLADYEAVTNPEVVSHKVTSWQAAPDDTHYPSEKLVKDSLDSKSSVSVSASGIATDEVKYITVDGVEKKIGGSVDISGKMDKANPTGTGSIAVGNNVSITNTNSQAFGNETMVSGRSAHVEGDCTTASGNYSHAEGSGYRDTEALDLNKIEGNVLFTNYVQYGGVTVGDVLRHTEYGTYKYYNVTATTNDVEITINTTPSVSNVTDWYKIAGIAAGMAAHSEGNCTIASGMFSHAEGWSTKALDRCSHTEGDRTVASGYVSHAEGQYTTASGDYSHTEGCGTTANHRAQHVFGEYNVADNSTESAEDRGNYVEIVGKGISNDDRSNARTLDWNGNEYLAGNLRAAGLTDGTTTKTMTEILAGGSGNCLPLAGGEMTGSILSSSTANNLGSASKRWGSLYLGTDDSAILDFGNNKIESADGFGFSQYHFNSSTGEVDEYAQIVVDTATTRPSWYFNAGTTSLNTELALLTDIPSIWKGTQAEYDALGTYDDNTLYFIKED